jgi:hypothetical protein
LQTGDGRFVNKVNLTLPHAAAAMRGTRPGDSMPTHRLDASRHNVHWGYFDASLAPKLTVQSGDTVEMLTVSGRDGVMPEPGSGLAIPAPEIAAAVRRLLDSANVLVNRPAAEAGLAMLDAGGDFADGVIAHEGQ